MPGRRQIPGEHTPRRADPGARVEHHAQRVVALDMAHRQLRVIGLHRAGTHHHGIHQRPGAVQMDQTGLTGDIVRGPGHRSDAPIQTLAELSDELRTVAEIGDAPGQPDRQQLRRLGVHPSVAAPAATRIDLEAHTVSFDPAIEALPPHRHGNIANPTPGERRIDVRSALETGGHGHSSARLGGKDATGVTARHGDHAFKVSKPYRGRRRPAVMPQTRLESWMMRKER